MHSINTTGVNFPERPGLIPFPALRERSRCHGDIVDILSGSGVSAQTVLTEDGDDRSDAPCPRVRPSAPQNHPIKEEPAWVP